MSANIYWRPVTKNNKSINTHAPSSFQDTMHKLGLSLPCTVEARHIDLLKGAAASFGQGPNPFLQMLELLEHHDAIELWAVY
jgi:hypothetical protein